MQKQNQPKLFAFKLAEKAKNTPKDADKWQARNSAATAGCSAPDYRADGRFGRDTGMWC
ncbi:hypothetical protein [Rheinheimera baltica]|uniref:Uncharacterized protein n=1 Tax=Rheinheimera baltica TaxID=67576 RepID=A0ABT9I528_9GAMM|nr:hypothetical protein [Rheinheimera baltica]MDP5138046.1 hypothetical protein [Rheinheimera baltica]MDP5141974.1 hypothetical protein [Rheinheimera baltica]MDP5150037.1 hypothetical protein [Rheinheimera baltica]MDP5190557.1 hypothetical protein [Rheinheimera baltica]